MADRTSIEWTDATVNFWWGCTKVGPGCDHCYAETWSERFGGGLWGVGAPRRKIKGAIKLIHKLDNDYAWWAADAEIGKLYPNSRRRVFIQSMSDLFDKEVPLEWFAEAWQHIEACDRLEIQIVTKRVSIVEKRLIAIGKTWPKHAGLIISVVNQEEADRDIPRLLDLKARLGIPWVGCSMEPLLGPVDLSMLDIPVPVGRTRDENWAVRPLDGRMGIKMLGFGDGDANWLDGNGEPYPRIDWVIAGGESGPCARPMHPDWARSLRDQCAAAGVPFLFKQHGSWVREDQSPPDAIFPGEGRDFFNDGSYWAKLGKKDAGRLLDGVQHDGFPS